MNWGNLTKVELLSRFLQMEERISELEEKLDQKDERVEEQNERIEEHQERIKELKTRLRKYENPHTPPSKRRSGTDESPASQDDEDDDVRTDGGTPGRKDGHDPVWRSPPDFNKEVDVTCDCCPECGEHFDESGLMSTDSSRISLTHSHQNSPAQPPMLPVRLLWNRDGCDSP